MMLSCSSSKQHHIKVHPYGFWAGGKYLDHRKKDTVKPFLNARIVIKE